MANHLLVPVKDKLGLDDDERILWMKNTRWIGYPRAETVLGRLDELVRHPKISRMPNMLLVGATNNGKTQLINKFLQRYPRDENPGGSHIRAPVLYFQAPPTPSEPSFYSSILSELYERVPSASLDAKRSRALQVLKAIELKVLVIDELHNILAGSSTKQQQFLNMVKFIGNELQISIVGVGTGDLLRAVSVDPQIQNRFTPELLPIWVMGKPFKQLLMSFERIMPLRVESNLSEKALASKILATCEGTIGELSNLLNMAAEYAIKTGVEQITTDIISDCGYVPPSDRTKLASFVL